MPGGAILSLKLAERGSWIGDRREGLWVCEARKLTPSGHQTSLISSAYGLLGLLPPKADILQAYLDAMREQMERFCHMDYNLWSNRQLDELVDAIWRDADAQHMMTALGKKIIEDARSILHDVERAVRDGGSYEARFKNIAVWNSIMSENDYLVKRWTEFLSA